MQAVARRLATSRSDSFGNVAAPMGRDPNFSVHGTPQSSRRGSDLDGIRLHITNPTDGLMTASAGQAHPLQYSQPAVQVTAECLRIPTEPIQSPPLLWSLKEECSIRQSTLNSARRPSVEALVAELPRSLQLSTILAPHTPPGQIGHFTPHSSTYLSSLNNQPGRIPGLYLPNEPLSMLIFGSLRVGRLDPKAETEYVSLWLYDMLRQRWPEDIPAALLPLYFPYAPEGPAAVYLSKAKDFSGTFVLGRLTCRRFQTMAIRAIAGELACAVQEGLTSDKLHFLQRRLTFYDFKVVNTPPPSLCKLMPGQRLCHRQDESQLIAVARGREGIPTELVAIVAPSDDDLSVCAHLATIAFRESVAKADESMSPNGCKVKVLVIARDCEVAIEMIYKCIPENVARRTLTVNKRNISSSLDRNYELVLTLMAGLEANPSEGNSRIQGEFG